VSAVAAVVFDWAGTMIDFGCLAPVAAFAQAFAAEGVSVAEADIRADMGMAKRDHLAALLALAPVRNAWKSVHGAWPDEADADRIYVALEPLMAAQAAASAQLIAGAAETARALAARGVRIGSGTGYTRAMMQPILQRAAAQGYAPEVLVCAGETPQGRPSPLPMWSALISLSAWPAWRCLKVDDAEVGIAEGVAAGAWTVGVAASGNAMGLSAEGFAALEPGERARRLAACGQRLTDAGAHYVIDSVADLMEVVDDVERRLAAGERPASA
jgi:phosphonoacetaldehyde hydrolase